MPHADGRVVVGAGVAGLAMARELAAAGHYSTAMRPRGLSLTVDGGD